MATTTSLTIYPITTGDLTDMTAVGGTDKVALVTDGNTSTGILTTPVGGYETFNTATLSRRVGDIVSVTVTARQGIVQGMGPTTITSLLIRILGTTYASATRFPGAGAVERFSGTWATNPDTGLDWEWTDFPIQVGTRHWPDAGLKVLTSELEVRIIYTLSDWNEAPANIFSFSGDADTAISEYLQNTAITDSNVSTLITYLEATVGTYRVTPLDVPKMDESLGKLPLVYIWTTGLRAEFLETDTEQVSTTTRILVWAENNNPETSADEVQAICGAIASALQQSDKTSGSDWADFYSNWGEPDVVSQEIQFITIGDDVGYCRGELTVDWGHFSG